MSKIEEFCSFMRKIGVEAFILQTKGEYLNEYSEELTELCGFTGTNGVLIITQNGKCPFFTDGRYTTQAHNQLDQGNFQVYNIQEKDPCSWIKANTTSITTLGYYSKYFTIKDIRKYENICELKLHPIEKINNYQKQAIVVHDIKYSSESSKDKCKKVATHIIEATLLTDSNSISWLLNLRNKNAQYTPCILGRAILYKDGHVDLFIENKEYSTIEGELESHINIFDIGELESALNKLNSVVIDPSTTQVSIINMIKNKQVIEGENPCLPYKAIKNQTEIAGAINAHIKDGVAVTNFLCWLEDSIENKVTELGIEEKLLEYRKEQELFKRLSFPTISAFNENGAIIHYRANNNTNKVIEGDGLYLIDSGGQYLDGTTDITRTIAIGKPTSEQIFHYTVVLKAHIAIASAIFPAGTTGGELDILARMQLWKFGMDYMHGTGHGVGSYLSVHEGPQAISKGNKIKLIPGMILSNEPGYYIPGKYGIRIENLMYIDQCENGFLCFKQLTCVPYDRRLIDVQMLTEDEIKWINDYHKFAYESLKDNIRGSIKLQQSFTFKIAL
ncbi:aminopeptidase family protein P [Wolbachia endosymbiont of Ctenocephalides felis wCfeT]|uniref:aminopeptidase family protein P n=1 Tax=Wolbachia endosymbiont of Ctenocephalides felis wCfeT TaxID=2732593 RepID=UPI001444C9AB|nr:aminopeptidase family protein P [Wolbachia endosymbiont of Ctenocephalides felis wCfeT]